MNVLKIEFLLPFLTYDFQNDPPRLNVYERLSGGASSCRRHSTTAAGESGTLKFCLIKIDFKILEE